MLGFFLNINQACNNHIATFKGSFVIYIRFYGHSVGRILKIISCDNSMSALDTKRES